MTIHTILSGGMDSTAALAHALRRWQDEDHVTVSFDYGQRHRRELASAAAVADYYQLRHTVVSLAGLLDGSALLTDQPVPDGKYDAPSMAATVVLGRNLLFAAAAIGTCQPGDTIVVGVHAGDHPIYADCRPAFWHNVMAAATAYDVVVEAPFLFATKADVARTGAKRGAPLHLTWSCYKGGTEHCGRCGTCVERAEAFALAGLPDPTVYADPDYWRSVV